MSDEKTEEPTEKKLRKAREQGEVTKSADLVEVACLGSVLLALQAGGQYMGNSTRAMVKDALDFVGGDDHTLRAMFIACADIFTHAFTMICGIAVLAMSAALLALAPQTGLQLSVEAVIPKLSSVSPASGFMRIFSMNSLIDLAKMTLKAAVIVAVMWKAIESVLPVVASALYQSIPQLTAVLWQVLLRILGIALVVFIVIGALDYKLQAWLFIRKQRMTKDEIKRERKDSDGNPEVKQERQRLAKKAASEGPKKDLSRANVLVVNPVHYSVALRYVPSEYPLPVVIAKGTDEQALELRRFAAAAGVPIVANPPVARMLYKVAENQPIPEDLFEVVAVILRWVNNIAVKPAFTE
jgi:type III secretion protein U